MRVLLDQGVEFKKESLPELYDQVSKSFYVKLKIYILPIETLYSLHFPILQTVSCKECKINEEDCLHMQWILMVRQRR